MRLGPRDLSRGAEVTERLANAWFPPRGELFAIDRPVCGDGMDLNSQRWRASRILPADAASHAARTTAFAAQAGRRARMSQ